MSSFFTKLYRVRKNSEEDYLTALFADVLEEVKTVGEEYIKFLCKKGGIEVPTGNGIDEKFLCQEKYVETLFAVSKGKIDLIVKTNKDIVFICENKWWGGLLEPNQISKYMSCKGELGFANAYSVLITPSMEQWDQDPDIKLLWSDIYEFLKSQVNTCSEVEKFILERFLSYLEDSGLATYNNINPAKIVSYFDVINLETSLKNIFNELKDIRWEQECPSLNNLVKWNESNLLPDVKNESNLLPVVNKLKWGRIGIDFFDNWNPGLFAGVILDPRDHKIEPDDRQKGPDFVVLLDVNCVSTEIYNSVVNSSEYIKLKENLSNNSGSFTFIPHENLENQWRLAVLKKPLHDILFSKYNYEEQKEAIKSAIIEGIDLISKGCSIE